MNKLTEKIVRSGPLDAHTLTKIAKTAKSCWGYPKEWLEQWESELTISPKDIDENFVFHVEQDGKVVGFYCLSGENGVFNFEHLWVLPESTGKGLGKMLLEHAKETALQNGGRKLRVESDPHAEGFYLKMGMHRVGEKESGVPGRMLPILEMGL